MEYFRRISEPFALIVVLLAAGEGAAWSDALDVWTWRNPLPTGSTLLGIAHGNGKFVAVGWNYGPGAIITSLDGITWSRQTATNLTTLRAITYGAGLFVAVGDPGVILSSADAVSWTNQVSGVTDPLFGITYGDGLFVTVGHSGTILTSPDAKNWTSRNSGSTDSLRAIAFGNGRYVAVGKDEEAILDVVILTSEDGISWTTREAQGDQFTEIHSIVFGNGMFVAVGDNGVTVPTFVMSSTDGISWAQNPGQGARAGGGVAFGKGLFVAVSDIYGQISTSKDGQQWTQQGSPVVTALYNIAYADDTFVAVGLTGNIVTSNDGVNWIYRSVGNHTDLRDIAYGNGVYTAISSTHFTPSDILRSTNGVDWLTVPLPWLRSTLWSFYSIVYGNDTFVAVGGYEGGATASSPDGLTWIGKEHQQGPYGGVAFGNGLFVAVGYDFGTDNGIVATSRDGLTWQQQGKANGSAKPLAAVIFAQGKFVAVGAGGTLITSDDGVSWKAQNSGVEDYLWSIADGNGRFVAVGGQPRGPQSIFLTSVDGISWISHPAVTSMSVWDINYGEGTFVGLGTGIILASQDGVNWSSRNSPTSRLLSGGTFVNGTFVAVGDAGTIIQSDVVNVPRISEATLSPRGFEITMIGKIGTQFRVQATTDFTFPFWQDLLTFSFSVPSFTFSDPPRSNVMQRFYRLVSP
jgi:hypothetical protein